LAIAMVVRTFAFEPFNIPSGSMKPTLLVGDYLFVSKYAYGYSRYSFPWELVPFSGRFLEDAPDRGDIVVFRYPRDKTQDYIKRVIGLPGDRVQMRKGVLYLNDQPVQRTRVDDFVPEQFDYVCPDGRKKRVAQYEETLPNGVSYMTLNCLDGTIYDDTRPFSVPAGHYFMMGDNRDNSTDSREWGFVASENLVGRAEILFFSTTTPEDPTASLWTPWKWPAAIRWGRLLDLID
jgi:signal peptidase I